MSLGICDDCGKEVLDQSEAVQLTFPDTHYVHRACNLEAIRKDIERQRLHSMPLMAGMTYGEWINDITKRWRLR